MPELIYLSSSSSSQSSSSYDSYNTPSQSYHQQPPSYASSAPPLSNGDPLDHSFDMYYHTNNSNFNNPSFNNGNNLGYSPQSAYFAGGRNNSGNFSNERPRGASGGSSNGGGGDKVCQFYARGDCRFGDRCRNLHI